MARFRPICVPCRREMRCRKNDYMFTASGSAVWASDMYECEGCGHQILTGFGRDPVAEAHEDSFVAYSAESRLDVEIG